MPKIVVTRNLPGSGIALLQKQSGFKVEVNPKDAPLSRAELLAKIAGADAVITELYEKVDAEFLKAAGPQLKIVANYAVGYDNFDLAALKANKVLASNTPGVLSDAVAEHTVTLIFAIAKRLCEADRYARAGKYKGWAPELLLGTELKGKLLGVIGLGRIGSGVVERCKAMGMKIAYHDVKRNPEFEKQFGAKFMERSSLLIQSDFVSIHVPLLPSTRHLIGQKQLAAMKPTAYLINTSRGPIIDELALAEALEKKIIRGAALDVFEFEPEITPALRKLDNIILTPHIASATLEARSEMSLLAAKNVIAALKGEPLLSEVKS